MCGGAGTRLWPVSTSAHPKQFHRLVTDHTVFQDTVLRLQADGFEAPIIISNQAYADLIRDQLAAIGVKPQAVILEPAARNTAAVAAVAARFVADKDADGLCLLLPSDHYIGVPETFRAAILQASPVSRNGLITTFGIRPDRPETGFGYIQRGEPVEGAVRRIAAFREKPDLETATAYFQDPEFSWNAGIFLFPAGLMIAEMEALAPDILDAASAALEAAVETEGNLLLDPDCFKSVRSISLDYAIMEKTDRAAVYAPLDCQWNDIGTWSMIDTLRQRTGDLEPILIDAANCTVYSDDGHQVAFVGVENVSLIISGNRILVAAKDRTQDVGAVVKAIRERGDTPDA
ncbi:MAG: sugar phosphate nucleotidyltransferase [Hyphomonas sp.]